MSEHSITGKKVAFLATDAVEDLADLVDVGARRRADRPEQVLEDEFMEDADAQRPPFGGMVGREGVHQGRVPQLGRDPAAVLDDDRLLRETLRFLLEGEGYTVVEAEDGERGLRALSEHDPCAAVVDLADTPA